MVSRGAWFVDPAWLSVGGESCVTTLFPLVAQHTAASGLPRQQRRMMPHLAVSIAGVVRSLVLSIGSFGIWPVSLDFHSVVV